MLELFFYFILFYFRVPSGAIGKERKTSWVLKCFLLKKDSSSIYFVGQYDIQHTFMKTLQCYIPQ